MALRGKQYISRANWLRAAVLGANDGILSTTSLVIGVAAAGSGREALVIAAVAGLVAGATSMAAGEYVSVCSQTDVEKSDMERQKRALEEHPGEQLQKLADAYRNRGLSPELAQRVAEALSSHDALDAHARDSLGIHEFTRPRPLQASLASAASFITGALLPLLVGACAPLRLMIPIQYALAIVFLALTGACAAWLGGCAIWKSVARVCFWGTVSMVFTALIGSLFGINV